MSIENLKSIPLPTLDRPFGIELWPIFEKIWGAARGFPPQDFRFVPSVTPMSTLKETAIALTSYYVIIFGGRELMKHREPFKFNLLFKAHNFFLTALSAGLLGLFIEQLLSTVVRNGIFYAICNSNGGWTDHLVVLYYLNYMTKYIELLDTVFLVLKKKPLSKLLPLSLQCKDLTMLAFLHTYHHGATALLCYTQLAGLTPISWVPITLNLLVHVFMYWYYFQSARGIKIWWKQYITILQIVQFVIDLGFVYFATYTYFTSTYWPWVLNAGECAGEEFAAIAGCAILSSYLLLFISFYIATYKKTGKGGRKRRNTATKATIDMARYEIPSVDGKKPSQERANGSAKSNGSATTSATPGRPNTRSRKA